MCGGCKRNERTSILQSGEIRREQHRNIAENEERRRGGGGERERKAEGEATCLHASNLLMVEGKQTISYYLCET